MEARDCGHEAVRVAVITTPGLSLMPAQAGLGCLGHRQYLSVDHEVSSISSSPRKYMMR
jgi:hypothetical protein